MHVKSGVNHNLSTRKGYEARRMMRQIRNMRRFISYV